MTSYYSQYSRVFVSVDCIIFGFDEGHLRVLIGKRQMDPGRGEWSLYGGFVGSDESVDDAASRTLFELTGLRNLYMRQVGAFGSIDRDPGERVISIAYCALINVKDYDDRLREEHGVEWVNYNQLPAMYSDHREMIRKARRMMQEKIKTDPSVSVCSRTSSRSPSCSVSMRLSTASWSISATSASASRTWSLLRKPN